MTQAEFAKGWKLLILQPWGRHYRMLTAEGTLTEDAKTQMELYFKKLQFGHPLAWIKVAELYAEGSEWPSITSLRQTLTSMNGRYQQALTDQRHTTDRVPMPDEIRRKLQAGGILKSIR